MDGLVPRRTAILVANQDFHPESGLGPLRGPLNDIAALANILRDPEYGKFEVQTLVNAMSFDIKVAIDETLGESGRGDLVLIHYAGHGRLDRFGNLCLVTRDTRARVLQATSIPAQHLKDLAAQSDCDTVILVLDCCYSGAAVAESRGDIDSLLISLEDERGFYILSASSEIQTVSEVDTGAGIVFGRFTAAFLDGIRTGAADGDRDGRISLYDMFRYVRGKVPGQTPRIFARAGGDPLISLNPFYKTPSISPQDARLVQGGMTSTTELVQSGNKPDRSFDLRPFQTITHPCQVMDIAFNRQVSKMATICDDGQIRIFSVDSFEQIDVLRAKPHTLRSASWSRAGHQVATGDTAGFVRLWRQGVEIAKLSTNGPSVTSVQHSPDGTRIAAGTDAGHLTMWHAQRREALWTQQVHSSAINTIDFSDEDSCLVTASADGTACIVGVKNGRELGRFSKHGSEVAAAFFISGDPGLASCVSAGLDGQICIWSAAKDSLVTFTTHHEFWVRGLSYCAENQTIISGSYDSMIKLIDLHTGNVFEARNVHPEALICVRSSPCGNYLGVATHDGKVHVLQMFLN